MNFEEWFVKEYPEFGLASAFAGNMRLAWRAGEGIFDIGCACGPVAKCDEHKAPPVAGTTQKE